MYAHAVVDVESAYDVGKGKVEQVLSDTCDVASTTTVKIFKNLEDKAKKDLSSDVDLSVSFTTGPVVITISKSMRNVPMDE